MIFLRKLDLLHWCNKRTLRYHTAPPLHGNYISTERDAKFIRSKGQQGTIYSVKRVLLIQVIKASWVSGTTYAFPSKVTNYSAIRDHGTELPPSTDAINKFELVVKYLKLWLGSVSITVSNSFVGMGQSPLIAIAAKYGNHFKWHWLTKLPLLSTWYCNILHCC